MKSMLKNVSALCIALLIFWCNSAMASAAVLPPGLGFVYKAGNQRFCIIKITKHDSYETHMHYIGINVTTGKEVYVSCTLTYHSEEWVAECICGERQSGSREIRRDPVRHSVN